MSFLGLPACCRDTIILECCYLRSLISHYKIKTPQGASLQDLSKNAALTNWKSPKHWCGFAFTNSTSSLHQEAQLPAFFWDAYCVCEEKLSLSGLCCCVCNNRSTAGVSDRYGVAEDGELAPSEGLFPPKPQSGGIQFFEDRDQRERRACGGI